MNLSLKATQSSTIISAIGRDGALVPIEKMAAHEQGVLHLAVSVFVFCGREVLLQQRAASKYHCGGLWANTCCTHPYWKEPASISAQRRLREEIGLNLPLTPANMIEYRAHVSNNLIEHERVHIFFANVESTDVAVALASEEVAQVRWVDIDALKSDAIQNPAFYAPWLRIYLSRWAELGLQVT
ncbi:isopentenyl-diphosphate Delta-isomerase [Candidatus Phycosocius spiralis]|uniref:Isopentenyl-diphosphate Delta-isomerase n=1 Tax=Candidatus Phycosocius spiralis TaxID=2815099 RepID=A0ABQ4PUL4_9PROT|nr:NUDIX domain-containing protein [Candidatus Phycosocius spiralis]GIU66720.1 isopentenyl-diphosphate Delta-isomerase [Candidatus Phycosocius spiralis]